MKEDYKVDPRSIHVDQRKLDTRRDAWNRDYMPSAYFKEFEETCRIEPKRNYTIWVFAFFFVSILVLIGSK